MKVEHESRKMSRELAKLTRRPNISEGKWGRNSSTTRGPPRPSPRHREEGRSVGRPQEAAGGRRRKAEKVRQRRDDEPSSRQRRLQWRTQPAEPSGPGELQTTAESFRRQPQRRAPRCLPGALAAAAAARRGLCSAEHAR